MTRAPRSRAICNPKMATPPVPCTSTVSPAFTRPSVTSARQAVTAAQGSVAASSNERCVPGDAEAAAALGQGPKLGQHPIHRSAQRRGELLAGGLAREPAGCEDARHTIAGFQVAHCHADCHHLAGSVRAGNQRQFLAGVVFAQDHFQIPGIERDRLDPDQNFARFGLRVGQLDELEVIEAEVPSRFDRPSSPREPDSLRS